MTYRIRPRKNFGEEARRVLRAETARALRELDRVEAAPARHVHQTRLRIKRTRALLRIVRSVDPYVYAVENRFFRDIARTLAPTRDRDALLEAMDDLLANKGGGTDGDASLALRSEFSEMLRVRRPTDNRRLQALVVDATVALRSAMKRYDHLAVVGLKKKSLRAGIERSVRNMKHAYRHACLSGDDEQFHELRKHTKYAMHQMELSSEVLKDCSRGRREQFRQLASTLGRHHDLCMMEDLLAESRAGSSGHLRRLRHMSEIRRRELRGLAKAQASTVLFGHAEPDQPGEPARWSVVSG